MANMCRRSEPKTILANGTSQTVLTHKARTLGHSHMSHITVGESFICLRVVKEREV